jgi:hypothetical protein
MSKYLHFAATCATIAGKAFWTRSVEDAMTREEFEADLRRDGYQVREGAMQPNVHQAAHAHDFDARMLVLEGLITLVCGNDCRHYGPGHSCSRRILVERLKAHGLA